MLPLLAKYAFRRISVILSNRKRFSDGRSAPVVELREYQLHCGSTSQYFASTEASSNLRKSLVPLRLFCSSETGAQLNVVSHFYYYEGGMQEREARRALQAKNNEWQEYLKTSRPCILQQRSEVYVEAPLLHQHGIRGFQEETVGESSPH